MLLTAVNAENGEMNYIQNKSTGEWGAVPATAYAYKAVGVRWVVIGDNYGEGFSREHAALELRHLGRRGIIVKFVANDKVSLLGLADLTYGKPVECRITRPDGSSFSITLNHSCNELWFDGRYGNNISELCIII